MTNLSNTQSQVLPHTHTESEITGLSTDLAGKQDKLVAGSNIQIAADGKTVSATDTTYTAGTNISINASNEISAVDTKYDPATQSTAGLMSAADKLKLDGIEPGAGVAKVSGVKGDAESSYREGLVNITKANIGLGNVDNTSDANKPISTATQSALDLKQNIADMPTDLGDFTNNAGFIKNTVNDLANYYKKTETYTQTEIDTLIQNFGGFEVVATLPTSDIKSNIIYLLGPIGTGPDRYEEWIYYSSTWTKIGETSVDLTNYVTTNTAQTISGAKTFSTEPVLPSKTAAPTNSATAPATERQVYDVSAASVKTTGDQTIAGVKTFQSSPVVPAPTNNTDAATKKYVDDGLATKQATLTTQTAYTTKGTSTKVPTISTNTLGQVTTITETDITFPVTSVNGSTGAVTVSEFNPGGTATTGYVLKKTADGYGWDTESGAVTSVNGQTGAVTVSEFSPSNAGNTDQVLTKTAGGYEWANASGGIENDTTGTTTTVTKIRAGSEAEYSSLGSKNSSTIYYVF